MITEGQVLMLDLWLHAPLADAEIEARCDAALRQSGATILDRARYQFMPVGLTSVWVLGESHCALHTYPEANYLAIDVFTCGAHSVTRAFEAAIIASLPVEHVQSSTNDRGRRQTKRAQNAGLGACYTADVANPETGGNAPNWGRG